MSSQKNSDTPLVSVITPSYNSMPYIIETIESVLAQDYPAIEHIVVDGGSTDGTVEVLKQYPHLRWVSEPDSGQSHAINKGFKMASGEIIGWLNSDDTYNPGAVSYAIEYLKSHSDIDLVYSDVQVINESNQPLRLAKAEPFSPNALLTRNIIKQPTIFMRKAVPDILDGVNEKLHYVMDHDFFLRMSLLFNAMYLPDVILANFRFCKGTKSHETPLGFQKEWLDVLTEIKMEQCGAPDYYKKIVQARKLATRSYYLSLAVNAAGDNSWLIALSNFMIAFSCDRQNIYDVGIWKLFFRTLLKNNVDSFNKKV